MKAHYVPASVPVHLAARKLTKAPDTLASTMRDREVLTVRCAFCAWTLTGPAVETSRRGNEIGVLARQKAHALQHVRRRAYKRAWRRRKAAA